MSNQPDGNWMDEWGACRVCGGEIPHGHTNNCDIFKMEKRERILRDALAGVIRVADRKTVEFDAARAALNSKTEDSP